MATITIMADAAMDLRLWQLISPALPVGAYAYSAGLEYAIEAGWVRDEAALAEWTAGQIAHGLARLDVAALGRLYRAWCADDRDEVARWTTFLLACRETAELRAEDRHLGRALARVLKDLGDPDAGAWDRAGDVTWATMFALAAARWDISLERAAAGYVWAWLENQVAAAVKIVPLGQTAGQRVLLGVSDGIPAAVAEGLAIEHEDDIGAGAPGVAIASSCHETQYSRLFRS
ncbi:MAG TPA: urease accessory protein UreF [Gammaproteobacteria bacterium]|nr:urease accessory protein UreF [Gammaproteobacteria bacterium]